MWTVAVISLLIYGPIFFIMAVWYPAMHNGSTLIYIGIILFPSLFLALPVAAQMAYARSAYRMARILAWTLLVISASVFLYLFTGIFSIE